MANFRLDDNQITTRGTLRQPTTGNVWAGVFSEPNLKQIWPRGQWKKAQEELIRLRTTLARERAQLWHIELIHVKNQTSYRLSGCWKLLSGMYIAPFNSLKKLSIHGWSLPYCVIMQIKKPAKPIPKFTFCCWRCLAGGLDFEESRFPFLLMLPCGPPRFWKITFVRFT